MKEKLKMLRERKNLTQNEIAKSLNINLSTYKQYEINRTEPNINTLIKLADFYKITVDELIDHEVPYLIYKSMLSEKQNNILNKLMQLNDSECDKVDAYIEGLQSAKDKNKIKRI